MGVLLSFFLYFLPSFFPSFLLSFLLSFFHFLLLNHHESIAFHSRKSRFSLNTRACSFVSSSSSSSRSLCRAPDVSANAGDHKRSRKNKCVTDQPTNGPTL